MKAPGGGPPHLAPHLHRGIFPGPDEKDSGHLLPQSSPGGGGGARGDMAEGAAGAAPAPASVLFVCGHNAGRSIAAECVTRALRPELRAASCGTYPSGKVNPNVQAELERRGYSVEGLFSKALDHESVGGVEGWDLVVTMGCMDSGACEKLGPCKKLVDWGLPDPHGDASVIPNVVSKIEEHVRAI